jgi:DNA-binding winged helix-turn-helix (wHTH) protein/tetratricopeptide (TPR) repeat protein
MVYVFGDNELDEPVRCLRRAGVAVPLEPKVFDFLLYLLRHRDRVVTRDELLEKLWSGVFVSDSALASCVKRARRAVGDDEREHRIIQTVHRHGFRFIAAVARRETPGVSPGAARAEASVRPFIARTEELRRIEAAFAEACRGQGRLLLIEGEPGIGKTRLTEEFAVRARASGAEVLVGQCYEGQGVPAFWAWVQIIRAYANTHSTAELAEIMGPGAADLALLVPSLRMRLPDLEPPAQVDPNHGRARLFDSIAAFLSNAAAVHPLVIVLEDLHWIQDSSLLLLQFLAHHCATVRVLMIGTYRDLDVERAGSLEDTVASLTRAGLCERIRLTGLDAQAVEGLLACLLGSAAPPAIGSVVSERTLGNPFFIEEMVRYWICERAIDPERGEIADPQRIEALGVPDGVRVLIGRRLAQLDDNGRRALSVAAVAGDTFGSTLIAAVAGMAHDTVVDALDGAIATGLVREIPKVPGRYSFAHALTRATLYHGLSAARRAQLHGQVGRALETLRGNETDPAVADLAYHFLRSAGDADKAVDYAMRAATQASAQFAHEDAARLLEAAREVLERDRPGDRARLCRVLLALAEAQRRSGVPNTSRDTGWRAAEIAGRLDEPLLLAQAAAQIAVLHWPHFLAFSERPIGLLEAALTRLDERNEALRARLLGLLAGALFMTGGAAERREALSREAVAIAQRTADPATLSRVLDDVALALWDPDHVDERLQLATQFRDLGGQVGDKEVELKAYGWRILSNLELGNLRAVDADMLAAAPLADQLRQPQYWWFARRLRFTRALLAGHLDEAEDLRQECFEVGRRFDEPGALLCFGLQTFALCRERGTLGDFEPTLREFAKQFPTLPWKWTLPYVYAQQGLEEQARAAFEKLAANEFRDLPAADGPSVWLGVNAILAEACATIGDRRRASFLYELLRPYACQWVVFQFCFASFGSVRRYLGRLATTLGRWKEAADHFEEALQVHRTMQAPCELARTQHDYARMLYARGRERDRREAMPLLDEALKTAQELKLGSLAADAGRLRALGA